jgi:hypothetical protein
MPCATIEHVALRKHLVEMRRIDVTRHDREQLDVLVGERSDEASRVSQLQLVERLVFDAITEASRSRQLFSLVGLG